MNDSAPPGDGPPASGAMPTKTNTGPRFALTDMTPSDFFASKVCHRARITGSLAFDKPSMKGQTYSITDCEVTGAISVYIAGGGAQLALDEMPTITIDHTDVNGGIYLNNAAKLTIDHSYIARGQWSLDDVWAPFVTGPAPFTVSNSVFYGPYMTQPSHTEALHVGDYGTGIRFTNVAFVQQGGPLANSGVTAAINFHGSGAVFDGCWFLWDGPTPAYYTVYIDGPGNVVKNCRFEKGAGDYVYPTSTTMATYISNRDLTSGALISLP